MPRFNDRFNNFCKTFGRRRLCALACLALTLAPVHALGSTPLPSPSNGPPAERISLAAIGDSNSLSYQDRLSHAPEHRGGAYRERTLQWGEVIDRLRGGQIDQGPWEVSGVSNPRLRWMDILGMPITRAPRKEDFRYNFANNGADCEQLLVTRRRQIPRLVKMMDEDPKRWQRGVVVIRIGLANLIPLMDIQVATPGAPAVQARVQSCMARFRESVAMIRSNHPQTHIVLVGSFDESNDPGNLDHWQSAREIGNIALMFDAFDAGLRAIVAQDPNASFFDDRAWFHRMWGSRDAQGRPAYKTVAIGPTLRVTNTMGDEPSHALLCDDHAGLVWNVLWAQALVRHLHDVAKMPVTPISDAEVERLVRSLTE